MESKGFKQKSLGGTRRALRAATSAGAALLYQTYEAKKHGTQFRSLRKLDAVCRIGMAVAQHCVTAGCMLVPELCTRLCRLRSMSGCWLGRHAQRQHGKVSSCMAHAVALLCHT